VHKGLVLGVDVDAPVAQALPEVVPPERTRVVPASLVRAGTRPQHRNHRVAVIGQRDHLVNDGSTQTRAGDLHYTRDVPQRAVVVGVHLRGVLTEAGHVHTQLGQRLRARSQRGLHARRDLVLRDEGVADVERELTEHARLVPGTVLAVLLLLVLDVG